MAEIEYGIEMEEHAEQFTEDMCRICMGAKRIQHDIFEHTLVDSVLSQVYDDPEQECAQYGELKLCDVFANITGVIVSYLTRLYFGFNLTTGMYMHAGRSGRWSAPWLMYRLRAARHRCILVARSGQSFQRCVVRTSEQTQKY